MQYSVEEYTLLIEDVPAENPAGAYRPTVFEVDLETYLAGNLVFEGNPVKVWAGFVPSAVKPSETSLTYNFVGSVPSDTLDGPDDVTSKTVQFDAYSPKRWTAALLLDALDDVLNGYTGFMGTTRVYDVEQGTDSHNVDSPGKGDDRMPQRKSVEYTFHIQVRASRFAANLQGGS